MGLGGWLVDKWDHATGYDNESAEYARDAHRRREVDIGEAYDAARLLGDAHVRLKDVTQRIREAGQQNPAMPPPMAPPGPRITAVASRLQSTGSDLERMEREVRDRAARWVAVFNDYEEPPSRLDLWGDTMSDLQTYEDIQGEFIDMGEAVYAPLDAVLHPIRTGKGLWWAANNPDVVVKQFIADVRNPEKWPELWAAATVTVASGGGGAVLRAAGASRGARAAAAAERASTRARTLRAKNARAVQRGEKPHGISQREIAIKRAEAKAREARSSAIREGRLGVRSYVTPGVRWNGMSGRVRARLGEISPRSAISAVGRGVGRFAAQDYINLVGAILSPWNPVSFPARAVLPVLVQGSTTGAAVLSPVWWAEVGNEHRKREQRRKP